MTILACPHHFRTWGALRLWFRKQTRHSERVNDTLLAAFADEHALTPRLHFAKRSPKSMRITPDVKATLFAAYVGAVYRDHGYDVVRDWIFALMDWDNM